MEKKKTEQTNLHKIKPAGRHLLTIGRDLIKDTNTALLELVKNSYDADAQKVEIVLERTKIASEEGISITVADDGHGMSYSTVTGVWLVPSTEHKQRNTSSESKKRLVQGRKGIGRYAASVLGDNLTLETSRDGEITVLSLDWGEFERQEYLDQVDVSVSTTKDNKKKSGTTISIVGNGANLAEWDETQISDFRKALRRLISPVHKKDRDTDFIIKLTTRGLPSKEDGEREYIVEPFPILEVFDYRISGSISNEGEAKLVFENAVARTKPEPIDLKVLPEEGTKNCGELNVDFKIYDLDSDSIENLIKRISDKQILSESGEKLGKSETKTLLKEISGISVYRNGFRIRPHGDPGYDWLELDRERVQRPGVRVGSDRVSGFIEIESEEVSGLIEKANREGLKENKHYERLVDIALRVLLEAENRRRLFKIKTGKERSKKNISETLGSLFDFTDVNKSLDTELEKRNVPEGERKKILKLIDEKVEESNRAIEDVKEIIAIYQGQATLGKVVKIVLHEGRNPLSYFQNQIPLIEKWTADLKDNFDPKILDQVIDRLGAIKRQAISLTSIFNKISPLAARRRARPEKIALAQSLKDISDIFSSEFKEKNITLNISCAEGVHVVAWKDDLNQAVVNLLDNSLYWLQQSEKGKRSIDIKGVIRGEVVELDYKDNGPGIDEKYIQDQVIFEPGFSTKPGGTGLGLAIAGEAIDRSGGKLIALSSNSGAHFQLELPLSA